jgi:hypothetical protein
MARLACDYYVRPDSNGLLRPIPVIGPRAVGPARWGKTSQVEHIPLGAGRWGNQAEKEIRAYANSQGL